MPNPIETRGEWVVGLNPDDRMPNDWLRMVARVFASYRKVPLKASIVTYIDGLNLSLDSQNATEIIVGITPGQSFVDDQFIGFIENSSLKIDPNWMIPEVKYVIVLRYQWVNQMPPQEPEFRLVTEPNVNPEEMLILGYIICHDDGTGVCNIELIDDKTPWYIEMIAASAGNTEVDSVDLLPYIIQIKSGKSAIDGGSEFPDGDPLDEEGTLDIGWSVDFHNSIGNGVNYNTRLSTDKINDGILYINGNKIVTNIDGLNGPNDESDTGDVYIGLENNIHILDRFDDSDPLANEGSDSGKACASLVTEQVIGGVLTRSGSSWCHSASDNNSSIQNRSNFDDLNSAINTLTLTQDIDVVTVNGNPIWHQGNLQSTGVSIMFLGYSTIHPVTRPDGSAIIDGDMYYNTSTSAYLYWQVDHWAQIAKTESMRSYEFIASEGQTQITGIEYNPDFIMIYIDGVKLINDEFIATDGINITLDPNRAPFRGEEVISIYTIFSGQALSGRLVDLSDIQLIGLSDGQAIVWDASLSKWINRTIGGASGDYVNRNGDTMTGSLSIDGGLTTFNGNRIAVYSGTNPSTSKSLCYSNRLEFSTSNTSDKIANIGINLSNDPLISNIGYNTTTDEWEINSKRILDTDDIVPNASVTSSGIVRQATNAEADAGVADNVFVTPSDMARNISSIGGSGIPSGGIIIWSGTAIPTEWVLCDGTNGTPDLTDRFILGSILADIGQTGGSADASVTNHTHGYNNLLLSDPATNAITVDITPSATGLQLGTDYYVNPAGVDNSNITPTGTTSDPIVGDDGIGKNIPPYYKLAYIMKI